MGMWKWKRMIRSYRHRRRNQERNQNSHPNPTEPNQPNVTSTGTTTTICIHSIDCAESIVPARGNASSCANLILRLRAISVSVAAAFAVAVAAAAATAVAASAIRVVKMNDSFQCDRVQSNSNQKNEWQMNPFGSSLTSVTIISYRLRLPESVRFIRAACWSTIRSLFFISASGTRMISGIAAAPVTQQLDH